MTRIFLSPGVRADRDKMLSAGDPSSVSTSECRGHAWRHGRRLGRLLAALDGKLGRTPISSRFRAFRANAASRCSARRTSFSVRLSCFSAYSSRRALPLSAHRRATHSSSGPRPRVYRKALRPALVHRHPIRPHFERCPCRACRPNSERYRETTAPAAAEERSGRARRCRPLALESRTRCLNLLRARSQYEIPTTGGRPRRAHSTKLSHRHSTLPGGHGARPH